MNEYLTLPPAKAVRQPRRKRPAKGTRSGTRTGHRTNSAVPRCKTCVSCRLRKCKCDGVQPRCGSCIALDRECAYPQDARCLNKPTRSEIQILEATIESLQEIIRQNHLAMNQDTRQATSQRGGENAELPSSTGRTGTTETSRSSPVTDHRPPSPDTAMSDVTDTTACLTDKGAGPSPSEVHVAGAISRDGDFEVHGVSSMFHRQSLCRIDLANTRTSAFEREKRNQISQARLVANAAVQRQRESFFMGNPKLAVMQAIDFDGVEPELATHLIDLHFNRTHFTYLFSYRPAITDSLVNKGPYCNKILLNAIYLSSSLYSGRTELRSDLTDSQSAGERFYRRIRALLVDHIDKPSIPSAVGLLLCGAALVSTGRPSAGWIHCGIAYRMIIDLGCHLTVESRRGNPDNDMALLTDVELEIRKRLYWGAFLTDSTQSLYFGRPPCLRASQARVPQLLLDTYEELEAWSPYLDPQSSTSPVVPYQPHPAYAISTFNAMVGLFEISSRIVHTFYSIHSLQHSSRYIREAKAATASELDRWWASLPDHLRFIPEKQDLTPPPHQITPLTTYHTLHILLQRPFLSNGHLSRHFNEQERRAGERVSVNAALGIWRLIERYKAVFTLRQAPYLISYSVYSAVVAILTQKSLERVQFTECMGFFWSALIDLQRGSNFGLQKPIDILKDMMSQFGEGIPRPTEKNQSDTSAGNSEDLFCDIYRRFDLEGSSNLEEVPSAWPSWSPNDLTISNAELDGMDWPDNDALYGLFNPDPCPFDSQEEGGSHLLCQRNGCRLR